MADGVVQVAPDSSGKKVDTSELTVSAQTVERQRIVIADNATAAALAAVENAAPATGDYGLITRPLAAVANASVPSKTEGNSIVLSTDLAAALRVVERPPVVLGSYQFAGQTAGYTGLTAGAILISFRWTDATKICAITRINVRVNTTTAAAAAGMIDRDVVIVRSFTAGDTGGTSITLTGNNNKMRTSNATTVVGSIMLLSSGALTAGTGTADANAIGLMGKQGGATEPVGLTLPPEDLFAYNVGKNLPIILAQNEGFRVRIPTAMPTSIVQRTLINVEWMELAAAGSF